MGSVGAQTQFRPRARGFLKGHAFLQASRGSLRIEPLPPQNNVRFLVACKQNLRTLSPFIESFNCNKLGANQTSKWFVPSTESASSMSESSEDEVLQSTCILCR